VSIDPGTCDPRQSCKQRTDGHWDACHEWHHDPLCSTGIPDDRECVCDLIAKVEARTLRMSSDWTERDHYNAALTAAEDAVKGLSIPLDDECSMVIDRMNVIAAIHALKKEK